MGCTREPAVRMEKSSWFRKYLRGHPVGPSGVLGERGTKGRPQGPRQELKLMAKSGDY